MIYLATPYAHKDPYIRHKRFLQVNKVAGQLMAAGHIVFSPISHTHPIAEQHELPKGWVYWKKFDISFLKKCDELCVLKLPGWEESVGVNGEIDFATENKIKISFLEPKDWLPDWSE